MNRDANYEVEDSFSEEDEEEQQQLFALTARESKTQFGNINTQINNDTIQDYSKLKITNSPTISSISNNSNNVIQKDLVEINSKYLEAMGEISILRARLKEIENSKTQQIRQTLKRHSIYSKEKESKIGELTKQVTKLEEEKNFFMSELKNPYFQETKRKKEEFISAKNQLNDNPNKKKLVETTITKPFKIPVNKPDYKSLFLESIWNHIIMGNSRKTIEILSKICITFKFEYFGFKILPFIDNLGISIVNFLIKINDDLKINEIILKFLEFLIYLSEQCILNNEYLSLPFLLSLIHNCLMFRSSTILKESIISILKFSTNFAKKLFENLEYIIFKKKINEIQSSQSETILNNESMENLQNILIKIFSLIFNFDIIEICLKLVLNFQDLEFLKKIWINFIPIELIRNCLSISCPINLTINMINSLICGCHEGFTINLNNSSIFYNYQEEYCDKELINLLLNLLIQDKIPNPKFYLYGLNRSIGNNEKIKLFDDIIPNQEKLIYFGYPLNNENERLLNFSSLKMEKNFNVQNFCLKFEILKLFENYLIINPNIEKITFIKSIETIKILIETMRIQQDLVMRNPRSSLVELRIKLISKIILLLVPLLLTDDEEFDDDNSNKKLIQLISPGLKRQMIVILTRISLSSILGSESIMKLLENSRIKLKFDGYLFNELIESKARLLNDYNLKDYQKLLNIETLFANGVEYGYNDEIIGISRDILEICLSPDEADNLYYAFVAENDDD